MIQKSIIPITIMTTIGGIQQAEATTFVITNIEQDTLSKQYVFSKAQDILVANLNMVVKVKLKKSEIFLASNLEHDLGADSLDIVEFIMDLEKEFNITIPDPVAEKIKTVENAVNYVYEKINQ